MTGVQTCAFPIYNFVNDNWDKFGNEIIEVVSFRDMKEHIDTLNIPQSVKELYIAKDYLKYINNTRKPLKQSSLKFLKECIETENLKNEVIKKNAYYAKVQAESEEYLKNLKTTDRIEDVTNADDLLKKLIEPYKGKVIYIDFWGSWCSPCKREMQYIPYIKDRLKNEDVVFMYFANNSPEESWKNVITEYKLIGNNVVHYNLPADQQTLIERKFLVSSFPTYIIIDKNGEIVNMAASKPSLEEYTVKQIEEYL